MSKPITATALPYGLTDDHMAYLDELRDRGNIDMMFDAPAFLVGRFGGYHSAALRYVAYWHSTRTAAPVLPAYTKSIAYDRESRDYAMRLDGKIVGFARTFHEAETTLDALVYELLRDEAAITADEQAERDALAELLLERDEDAAAYGEDRAAAEAARYAAYGWPI